MWALPHSGKGDGAGHRRDANDHPGAVLRNPVRDPMRGVDLMVLGYVVGASTPLQAAPGNRRQFASRTQEPPFELKKRGGCAQPYARDTVFPGFRSWRRLRKGRHITKMMSEMCLPMRNPVRRAPFSQDLDRRAASKRAQKRRWVCAALCAGHRFPRI